MFVEDEEALDPNEPIIMDTAGSFFPVSEQGAWAALVVQEKADGTDIVLRRRGFISKKDCPGKQYSVQVVGIRNLLQELHDQGILGGVTVRSTEGVIVKALNEYMPDWKRRNGKRADGKKVANYSEWLDIERLSNILNVEWQKRKKGKGDGVAEIDHIDRALDEWKQERLDELARKRGMARDPYG
ncbi:hypothetical protein PZ897_20265 [Hoeflea sp. YIM 152468]|uniref:hypothetical protein n=1 Tax=Hoeflea sp. YIM 152468 TaxID=3031759 RepID=UPI0023DA6398|nr:hypothetical protein [Hoeflea sp. YIM 152468]MDF1610522.1 hypothetical protein [Hoeflea sp. YIM 152468]